MKRFGIIAFTIIAALTLAGCKKAEDNSLKDKLGDVSEKIAAGNKTEDESAGKKKTEKPAREEETDTGEGSLPRFYISTERSTIDDDDTELIAHRFNQIHMDSPDGEPKELAINLEKLNEAIGENESIIMDEEKTALDEAGKEGVEELKNNGFFPHNEEWNIYVRRADSDVLSVAVEYRDIGDEGDAVTMEAHTFSMVDGKELTFSDVVVDEDGFYELLARELYAVVVRDMRVYLADVDDADPDDFDAEAALDDCINNNRFSWVLDPQGITFWFENVNAVIGHVTVTVLFSDDTDKTIFNKKYSENVPDEWMMQILGNYSDTFFDNDDDGTTDSIGWLAQYTTDKGGNSFISGVSVNYNDRYFPSEELCPPDSIPWENTKAMLIHRDSKTILLVSHDADYESYFTTFTLENDMVDRADSMQGAFAAPDPSVGYGAYVPQDISAMEVITVFDPESEDDVKPRYLSVEANGYMTVSDTPEESKETSESRRTSGLSAEDAEEIANNLGGNVRLIERHDYDYDGEDEAFVILGEDDEYGGILPEAMWFISSDGKTKKLRDDFRGLSLYTDNGAFYVEYPEENRVFFRGDCGGYGSGWTTFIFGVKDGKPYELDLSMNTEGFYQDLPGEFYTLTDNYDDGHAYLKTELIYNSKTGQFKKGKITDEDWLNG